MKPTLCCAVVILGAFSGCSNSYYENGLPPNLSAGDATASGSSSGSSGGAVTGSDSSAADAGGGGEDGSPATDAAGPDASGDAAPASDGAVVVDGAILQDGTASSSSLDVTAASCSTVTCLTALDCTPQGCTNGCNTAALPWVCN